MRRRAKTVVAVLAVSTFVGVTAAYSLRHAAGPSRCPSELHTSGARCCAEGQIAINGRCSGAPLQCPAQFDLLSGSCVRRPQRVLISAGHVRLGPGDWEAQGIVAAREIAVIHPFRLDAFEVTVHEWNRCVDAGACSPHCDDEAGLPIRAVAWEQAVAYCLWVGGSLPSEDEWLLAALGPQARRYPWGDTGAVCGRAGWGLANGPCADSGDSPDWSGIHSGDRTPCGVFDMAGSVSEWVVSARGTPSVRGGSWRTSFAAGLRSWMEGFADPMKGRDDVGIRCRYPELPAVLPSGTL